MGAAPPLQHLADAAAERLAGPEQDALAQDARTLQRRAPWVRPDAAEGLCTRVVARSVERSCAALAAAVVLQQPEAQRDAVALAELVMLLRLRALLLQGTQAVQPLPPEVEAEQPVVAAQPATPGELASLPAELRLRAVQAQEEGSAVQLQESEQLRGAEPRSAELAALAAPRVRPEASLLPEARPDEAVELEPPPLPFSA